VKLLAARGVVATLWTVDSRDWTRPGVARILATVARELRPGAIGGPPHVWDDGLRVRVKETS
jgi:hypothetical protein